MPTKQEPLQSDLRRLWSTVYDRHVFSARLLFSARLYLSIFRDRGETTVHRQQEDQDHHRYLVFVRNQTISQGLPAGSNKCFNLFPLSD